MPPKTSTSPARAALTLQGVSPPPSAHGRRQRVFPVAFSIAATFDANSAPTHASSVDASSNTPNDGGRDGVGHCSPAAFRHTTSRFVTGRALGGGGFERASTSCRGTPLEQA